MPSIFQHGRFGLALGEPADDDDAVRASYLGASTERPRRSRVPAGGDALVVDVVVRGPDGTTWVDLRGLTYAPVESAPAPVIEESGSATTDFVDWAAMNRQQTVAELRTRLRSILATLGIMIGIAAVSTLLSVVTIAGVVTLLPTLAGQPLHP